MDECVLAEGPGRIGLRASGDAALLSITDEVSFHFPVETAVLLGVLDDVPIQLSSGGSHCRIESFEGRVRLDFVLAEGGRGSGLVEASKFAQAVAWVSAQSKGSA